MKKKSEFEFPKIEVIMFSPDEIVGTYSALSGKWEEEGDWIDPEDNIY